MIKAGERAIRLGWISQCTCGAEMSVMTIERRSPHVEVHIFFCSQCLRELRLHLSDDEALQTQAAATGL